MCTTYPLPKTSGFLYERTKRCIPTGVKPDCEGKGSACLWACLLVASANAFELCEACPRSNRDCIQFSLLVTGLSSTMVLMHRLAICINCTISRRNKSMTNREPCAIDIPEPGVGVGKFHWKLGWFEKWGWKIIWGTKRPGQRGGGWLQRGRNFHPLNLVFHRPGGKLMSGRRVREPLKRAVSLPILPTARLAY